MKFTAAFVALLGSTSAVMLRQSAAPVAAGTEPSLDSINFAEQELDLANMEIDLEDFRDWLQAKVDAGDTVIDPKALELIAGQEGNALSQVDADAEWFGAAATGAMFLYDHWGHRYFAQTEETGEEFMELLAGLPEETDLAQTDSNRFRGVKLDKVLTVLEIHSLVSKFSWPW